MGSYVINSRTSSNEEDDHSSYALQLVFSGALPMVLNTVIKLNVFEIIAKAGPGAQLSPFQIVTQMPSENPEAPVMLDRMLRMLAAYSVFTSSVVDSSHGSGQRVYGLGPASKYFVKNENGASLGPLLDLLQDKVLNDMW
jgi:caffeic acid 3-O-methyltransferase / acetylserotonin O-methyltransferase